QRLGLAGEGCGRQARDRHHLERRHADRARQDTAADLRRVGTRLLPRLPESPAGPREGLAGEARELVVRREKPRLANQETTHAGHYSTDHPHPDPDWCPADMAVQQRLGLLPERRRRPDPDHRDRLAIGGTDIATATAGPTARGFRLGACQYLNVTLIEPNWSQRSRS